MASKATAPSYADLSSDTYTLCVEAYASANKRALDYAKSMWEIASRPYTTTAIEVAIQENFDRANKMVSLTVGELTTNGQKSAEFTEKLAANAAKLQEMYTTSVKGLVDTGLSNLSYVKDTATQQFEDLTKRMEDIQKNVVASVSAN